MASSCKCNDLTDVRGLCFTCIGEPWKMTLSYFFQVIECPMTPYAFAYWIYNNHRDLYLIMMKTHKIPTGWANKFAREINLILNNIDLDEFWVCMVNMEKD